jgi:hypothetical protein
MKKFAAGLPGKDDPRKNLALFAEELVSGLMLTQINPERGVTKSNLEQALHEQEVVRNFIWAWGFQMFMKFWLSHVRPARTEDAEARARAARPRVN